MNVFPAFIPLWGARVVVVGDGEAAEAKARLFAGAPCELVRVPEARALAPESYAGARLAFVAVAEEATAEQAAALARGSGALVNVVDRQQLGDFHTPSIVDRTPVVAAIGTGGAAPVFATLLRGGLEARWPEGLGRVAALSGELQTTVREALPDQRERRAYWRRMLKGPAGRAAEAGDLETARRLALAALAEPAQAGRVLVLPIPSRAELLSLAAVRALGDADRIVGDSTLAKDVLGYARRDAPRLDTAAVDALAAWARAGETVVVLTPEPASTLVDALAAAGVEAEALPVAG